jgi:phage protein D
MSVTSSDRLEVQVSINGTPVSGLVRASITTTNCFSADTYSLAFALGPDESDKIEFFSTLPSAYVEVTAVMWSTYGPTYQTLITGMIDMIHVDPIVGVAAMEGRDLSSLLVDSYRQRDFVNQTASEIVSAIGQYHNLQPMVTATSGIIGRYYGDGYTKLSLGQFSRLQSEWDLVVQLARQNNFDAFVSGRSLYFQPADELVASPISISAHDVQTLRIARNLNSATDAAVVVQSWNSQNGAAYHSSGDAAGVQSPADTSMPFLFLGSNYTSQQVADQAERYQAELSRLSTVLHLGMPWDMAFAPRATLLLGGTGSAFDTTFRVDSIERHYTSASGSTQTIRAAQIAGVF